MGGHAGGCGVDEAVGAGEVLLDAVRGLGGRAARAEVPVQRRGQARGAFGHRVHDGEVAAAQGEHGVRDGRARAARAELHDAVERGVGQATGEGCRESGDVGVVADGAPALEDDGVDGAERLGLRGELVEVLDDELLAGVRDVQAVVAHGPGRPHQVADLVGGGPQGVDVDQPVEIAKALAVGLPLMERGAQRGADARTDQTDEAGVLRHRFS